MKKYNLVHLLEQKMKKLYCKKIFFISSLISIFQLYLSLYTDQLAFDYYKKELTLYENLIISPKMIIYKGLYFIVLLIIWNILIYSFVKKDDLKIKRFLKYFLPYWIIMIIFVFITWPGVWRHDEFDILKKMQTLDFKVWQHYLTSVYYIIGFMIIPFPAGFVFIQVSIISSIVGYILYKFSLILNEKIVYILYIPFMLFATIDQNLYPLRSTMFTYLELLLFCKMIFIYKNKERISNTNILFMIILSSIVSVWRSEAIFFIILIPIIFNFIFKGKIKFIKRIIIISMFVLISIVLMTPQKVLIQKEYGYNYKLISIMAPMHNLAKKEFNNNNNSELLYKIDKIVDIEKFLNAKSGVDAYWSGVVRKAYTKQEFKELEKTLIKLIIKYPKEFLTERIELFIRQSGFIQNKVNTIRNTTEIYDSNINNTSTGRYEYFKKNFIINEPLNAELRKNVISILEGRQLDNYYRTTKLYPIIHNLFIPGVLLFSMFIISILKKNILNILITLCLIIQSGIVFFSAPSAHFMYYFPMYLIVYFFSLVIIIRKYLYNKQEKL